MFLCFASEFGARNRPIFKGDFLSVLNLGRLFWIDRLKQVLWIFFPREKTKTAPSWRFFNRIASRVLAKKNHWPILAPQKRQGWGGPPKRFESHLLIPEFFRCKLLSFMECRSTSWWLNQP